MTAFSKGDIERSHTENNKNAREGASLKNEKEGKDFKLKILTYNTFMRPPLICDAINRFYGDFKNQRLAEFIEHYLAKYDIVCLQEMFGMGNSRPWKLMKSAKALGFEYQAHHVSRRIGLFRAYDSGLVTLSRYPILETKFCPFIRGTFADKFAQKGVLYTKIKLPNEQLHVFNTHTQASYGNNPSCASRPIRKRQLNQIKDFVRKCVPLDMSGSILIMGDFNVNMKEAEYHYLSELMTGLTRCYYPLHDDIHATVSSSRKEKAKEKTMETDAYEIAESSATKSNTDHASRINIANCDTLESGAILPIDCMHGILSRTTSLKGIYCKENTTEFPKLSGDCLDYAFWIPREPRRYMLSEAIIHPMVSLLNYKGYNRLSDHMAVEVVFEDKAMV